MSSILYTLSLAVLVKTWGRALILHKEVNIQSSIFLFPPPSKENHKRAVLISASSQDRSFVRCCFSMFPSSESTQVWYSVYCLKPGPSTWGVSVGGVNQTQVVFQDQNVIPPGLSWCVKLYTERPSQWDLGVKVLSISAMKFKAGGFGGKAG